MTTFRSMLDVRPDLFVHVGDTIYADEPMEESVELPDGSTWRNDLTEEVTVVAQTLAEFRGRHRYPLRDDNVRDFYAQVPSVVQWDDHETCNNWWPGEIIEEDGYDIERRADVLATRGRRAWQEYQPVPVKRLVPRDGDGFVPTRIYRKVPRGQHLDLFLLDMRSYRGPNPDVDPAVVRRRLQVGPARPRAGGVADPRAAAIDRDLEGDLDRPAALGPAVATPPTSTASRNGDDGRPLGREHEIGRVLSAIKRHGITRRRLDHRRRALHRRPPLLTRAGGLHRLRAVLGVRLRAARRARRSRSGPTRSTAPSARRPRSRTARRTTTPG